MKAALHTYHPSRFLATPKGRKVMKTMNTFKITILCGFITILVLRGTLGPGGLLFGSGSAVPSGQSTGDMIIMSQRARVLSQVEEAIPDEVTASKFVEEEKWDPSTPYTLGPKITDWDVQRATWNARNPGRNVSVGGKPKTLLVSGSQPGPCANPLGDFYHLKFLKNRVDYARLHGLEFFYNMATFEKEMTSFWAKLPLLRKVMLNHPDVEWLWWMDSDAIFTDMTFEMPMEKYENMNLVVHGFHNLLFEQRRWIGLNTGSFLIRNCQWSLDLLDALAPFGPEGETRVEAGKIIDSEAS
jgi:xyloglucan 6-xylosyltransferase